MAKIDRLYGIESYAPMPTLEQSLSVNMCREISSQVQYPGRQTSESQQEATKTYDMLCMSLLDKKTCVVCYHNKRQVVYDCGHMIVCTDCHTKNAYTICIKCHHSIKHIKFTDFDDASCITDGCVGLPSIMHTSCSQIVYCTPCWNVQLYVQKSPKKRKLLSIKCKCGDPICQFIKIIH